MPTVTKTSYGQNIGNSIKPKLSDSRTTKKQKPKLK